MTEFDIYCSNKTDEIRARLLPVRTLIMNAGSDITESRVHFYLVYHIGALIVAKLDNGPKDLPRITFVGASELEDPNRLLNGKGPLRTISVKSETWFADHEAEITALVEQSYAKTEGRPERDLPMRTLRPDQPSP